MGEFKRSNLLLLNSCSLDINDTMIHNILLEIYESSIWNNNYTFLHLAKSININLFVINKHRLYVLHWIEKRREDTSYSFVGREGERESLIFGCHGVTWRPPQDN